MSDESPIPVWSNRHVSRPALGRNASFPFFTPPGQAFFPAGDSGCTGIALEILPVSSSLVPLVNPQPLERFDALPRYTTDMSSDTALKWSGLEPVPEIGSEVLITINRIGMARVVSYAAFAGYLGLMAYPLNPPDWWICQNGAACADNASLVFGAEIRRLG